jgi:hypothetical protein
MEGKPLFPVAEGEYLYGRVPKMILENSAQTKFDFGQD